MRWWWLPVTHSGYRRGGWTNFVGKLGIASRSTAQGSLPAKALDSAVEAFRTGPLNADPNRFVAADALVLKVNEGGPVVNVRALIALGINSEGYREVLGIDVTTAEDAVGRPAFRRPLPSASRQRCRDALHEQPDGRYSESMVAAGANPAAFGV